MNNNILVIDDEEPILSVLQLILKNVSARLVLTQSGNDALSFLETNSASLVIIDYSLPVMNGIETLQRIRSLTTCRDIKVIMLSARDQKVLKEEAEGLNVSVFIPKPFNTSDLLKTVQSLMSCLSSSKCLETAAA
jgi:CheY-like chemotaxis protein